MWRLGTRNARVALMRKAALLVLGLAGLAMGAAAVVRERRVVTPPTVAAEKAETLAVPDLPPEARSPATPPARETPPPAPAAAAAPDLPTVEVKPRPVYAVPSDEPAVPKVTLFDRSGKEIPTRQAALPPYVPPAPPPIVPFG